METIMLFSALAFVSIAMTHHAVACDFTHTTSASKQNATVVARSGGKCEAQSQTLQEGNSAAEAR